MKRILVLIVFLVLLVCGLWKDPKTVQMDCPGIDISKGEILTQTDTHGGFHGDGMLFVTMSFSDNTEEDAIGQNTLWKELPLTENLTVLIYGIHGEENGISYSIGPYISRIEGEFPFPKIENGYYYFQDRQTGALDDTEVITRNSFNYTMAIYDSEHDILYYCEYDT